LHRGGRERCLPRNSGAGRTNAHRADVLIERPIFRQEAEKSQCG
jgi:hypothetical protein